MSIGPALQGQPERRSQLVLAAAPQPLVPLPVVDIPHQQVDRRLKSRVVLVIPPLSALESNGIIPLDTVEYGSEVIFPGIEDEHDVGNYEIPA